MIAMIAGGALLLVLLLIIWVLYNGLVNAQNVVQEGFSGIDVQLKRRFELIPNLIEAVKGYNAHEASLLEKIVETRNTSGSNVLVTADADRSLTGALKSFRVQVENYPDLQANTQFLKLMDNLSLVENELALARRYYNGAVREFNIKVQRFPGNLVAGITGYKNAPFYEIERAEERESPEVNLSKDA
jgi:LemA protein